jgi:hypothetical protein
MPAKRKSPMPKQAKDTARPPKAKTPVRKGEVLSDEDLDQLSGGVDATGMQGAPNITCTVVE